MKQNIFKCLMMGIALSFVFVSCRKDDYVDDDTVLDEGGNTLVKFLEGPSKNFVFAAFTNMKPINGFTVRKDNKDLADVNTAATINLTQSALPAGYTQLPDNMYTLQTHTAAKFTKNGTGWTVQLPAGVYSAEFDVVLNGALMDAAFKANPTLKYGMGYTIASTTNGVVTATTKKSMNLLFVIKSPYEAIYTLEAGSEISRYTAGNQNTGDALQGSMAGKADRTLATIDAVTLSFAPVWADGTAVGGIDNTRLKVDPVTNLVTVTSASNATLMNTPGKTNAYDPATRTFTLNFEWGGGSTPGVTTNGRVATMIMKYKADTP